MALAMYLYASLSPSRCPCLQDRSSHALIRGAADPHEAEILFAPLAGLEVRKTHVEGRILVVEVHANINLTAQTIEQVVSKRHGLISNMGENIKAELHADLARDGCVFPCCVAFICA